MDYANGTFLTLESGPFQSRFVAGRALCSDGKVRKVRFYDGIADTFFSIPSRVNVGKRTVSGYVTTETLGGWSTASDDDPIVVKFVAYQYGANADALPRGTYRQLPSPF